MDSAMPTAVAAIVIHTLSSMPSIMSPQRLVKSGGKKAAMKRAPRGSPSDTRAQLISSVPSARAR